MNEATYLTVLAVFLVAALTAIMFLYYKLEALVKRLQSELIRTRKCLDYVVQENGGEWEEWEDWEDWDDQIG